MLTVQQAHVGALLPPTRTHKHVCITCGSQVVRVAKSCCKKSLHVSMRCPSWQMRQQRIVHTIAQHDTYHMQVVHIARSCCKRSWHIVHTLMHTIAQLHDTHHMQVVHAAKSCYKRSLHVSASWPLLQKRQQRGGG